jgi:hypothetical protein
VASIILGGLIFWLSGSVAPALDGAVSLTSGVAGSGHPADVQR